MSSPSVHKAYLSKEIRKMTPPRLDHGHLGERIIGERPMRKGSPAMRVRLQEGKVIVDNFGHGGSGWTLAPGAAKHVIDLLESTPQMESLTKETPVCVLGAGILGLFSALELLTRGYQNITIVAAAFENLTSHTAGGLFSPVSMNNDPDYQHLINEIVIYSYEYFSKIAHQNHLFLNEGVTILPTYWSTRQDSGFESYEKAEIMQPAKDVILDFQNGTQRELVVYDDSLFVDTGSMMTSLQNHLRQRVLFKQQTINHFSELPDQLIINCTGLGARDLVADHKLTPVQGHLIMLKDQNPDDLQHMILIYSGKGKTKSGFPIQRSFYLFPKRLSASGPNDVGVIGGTFIEGADHDHQNEEEFDILIQGAKDFYGIK